MARLAVLLLLLCLTTQAFGTPSTPDENECASCFSESEWAAAEAEILAEQERTAKEAAQAAVVPHLAYEKELLKRITLLEITTVAGGVAVVALTALSFILAFHTPSP